MLTNHIHPLTRPAQVLLLAVLSPSAPAAPQALEAIVVTATRTASPLAEVPGSITLITRQELEAKGSGELVDALRGTTGIHVQGIGGGGRKALSLRGMESKHTLILVDGKRVPGSNDVFGPNTDYQYDWLPVEQIERIEVVRGPMSVLYGSDALGGVINLITRQAGKKWSGQIKTTGRHSGNQDGGDGYQATFSAGGGLSEHWRLQLNALQAQRSAVADVRNPLQSALEAREQRQLGLDLQWQPAIGHTLRLEHNEGREQRDQDLLTRANKPYRSHYDQERRHTALGWDGLFGAVATKLRAYQSSLKVENSATPGGTATDPQHLRERVIEGYATVPLGKRHLITAGLEYRTEWLAHPKLPQGEQEAGLASAYFQDEIEFTPQLRLTLGARQDEHERFGGEFSPRLALAWDATEQWTLRTGYGHGFRSPTLKQIAPDYRFAAGLFIIQSNPALQPETNDAWEVGARYAGNRLEVDAAVFDNQVRNLIDTRFNRMLDKSLQEWVYDNVAEARLRGIELSARWQLNSTFSLSANYQYLDAEDGAGKRLERRPRHTLAAGLAWEQNGWQASLRAEHQAVQQTIPPGASQLTDLPAYTLWSAQLRKTLNPRLSIAVGIENVSDVRLAEQSPNFRHEEYPRTLWLELRGRF